VQKLLNLKMVSNGLAIQILYDNLKNEHKSFLSNFENVKKNKKTASVQGSFEFS
jgi:hypothetical protein